MQLPNHMKLNLYYRKSISNKEPLTLETLADAGKNYL